MKISEVIDNYSLALGSLCETNKKILDDLIEITKIFTKYKDYITILNSDNFTKETREKMVDQTFNKSNDFQLLTINFLKILIQNNHFYLLLDIIRNFFKLDNSKKNVMNVVVETVFDLSSKDKSSIINWLAKKLNKKILCEFKINKKLIGGIKIFYDSIIVDYSVEGKINNIGKKISGRIKEDEFIG